jgi:hypothetical protein
VNRELIDFCERKMLINIFGPSQAKELWRIRQINKIYRSYDDVERRTFLLLKRLQWAGLVVRIDDSYVRQKSNGRMFRGKKANGKA